MQSLSWYWRRLRTMSASEIAWRVRNSLRDRWDRALWRFHEYRTAGQRIGAISSDWASGLSAVLPEHLASAGPGAVSTGQADAVEPNVRQRVLSRAESALRHRLSFFDQQDVDLGDPINWNRDIASGIDAPMTFASGIDYRDFRQTGDCKLVWEPNRHQHLVALAQAWHLTGDRRFAEEIFAQIDQWMSACPFGYGMNWRSPLELAIRLINWVYALGMTREAGWSQSALATSVAQCAYRHLWDIQRKYSRYSSANNHLVGEAAGVWIGASAFRNLRGAERMRLGARDLLLRQMVEQQYADGGNREQALSYHMFVLEFFLLSALTARRLNEDFPQDYWKGLERMYDFAAAMLRAGDPPVYGDADDGYVLGLSDYGAAWAGLMSVGAVLFHRPEWMPYQPDPFDRTYWLLGPEASRQARVWRDGACVREPSSRAFPQTGIYLLEGRLARDGRYISVWMDAGELGMGPLAAHGHADALSLILRIDGQTILCDPGTYDYFTYPAWRAYFRSTRAHNTVMVDEVEQSEPTGPFMWGARARARCLVWQPDLDGGAIEAEHDGYSRLPDPVIHRRRVQLKLSQRMLIVTDFLTCRLGHNVHQHWHLGASCEAEKSGDNMVLVRWGGGHVRINIDSALEVSLHPGQADSLLGWFSPGYHQRCSVVTVRAFGQVRCQAALTTTISILE